MSISDDERAVRRAEWRNILNAVYEGGQEVRVYLRMGFGAVGRVANRLDVSSELVTLISKEQMGTPPWESRPVEHTVTVSEIVAVTVLHN